MKYFSIKDSKDFSSVVKEVVLLLKNGALGAIPTETLYGLAGNPFSEEVLKKIFRIKKREKEKPILVLISDLKQLELLVEEIPEVAKILIEKFWPGPLTIVFPAKKHLSPLLTGGTNTIGIRFSSSEFVRKLIDYFGLPITGTSANPSGLQKPLSPEEIRRLLPELDFLVDAGEVKNPIPSTVVSVINNKIKLIREGVIPVKEIYSSSSPSSLNSISK